MKGLGDKVSALKLMAAVVGLPEQIFWAKMEMFLEDIYSSVAARHCLCAKFEEVGKRQENAFRLVEIINRVESKQKFDI